MILLMCINNIFIKMKKIFDGKWDVVAYYLEEFRKTLKT